MCVWVERAQRYRDAPPIIVRGWWKMGGGDYGRQSPNAIHTSGAARGPCTSFCRSPSRAITHLRDRSRISTPVNSFYERSNLVF